MTINPKGLSTNPGIINGPLYKAARLTTQYVNVPPSFHRLRNAIGLTLGLFLGRKAMDVLVGQTPDGTKVDPMDLPMPLRSICGVLPYDHFSDDPKDRWMKVFDRFVPAVTGGIGACMGSASFFQTSFLKPVEAKMAAPAKEFFLADAERQTLYHQAKPWSVMTGTSALFGSASGFGLFPSVSHYGADLGTLFVMRSERAAAPLGALVNSHTHMPFRPTKLINNMIEYVAGNPTANPAQLNEYANGILKTWFRGVKDEQIQGFVDIVKKERAQFIKEGRLPEESAAKLKESMKKMLGDAGIEKTFIKLGLDPREAAFGDQGFISIISKTIGDTLGLGVSQKSEKTWQLVKEGIELRNPELAKKAFDASAHQYAPSVLQKGAAFGAIGASAAGMVAISTAKDADVGDLNTRPKAGTELSKELASADPTADMAANAVAAGTANVEGTPEHLLSPTFGSRITPESIAGAQHHILHSKKQHGIVNGKVLDAAEGVTDMFNVINGVTSHRLYCAVGLTAGSWLGEEVMKALTGVNFFGVAVKKEDVLKPLQKVYKSLAFNPHSDLPKDKWMQIMRWGVPTAIGGAAVVVASGLFFKDKEKEFRDPKYLDDVEEAATFAQAKPWSYLSAVTALFGGSSGFAWIPGINYMTNLGTRYTMASGRKVSLPAVGAGWSNNSTLFPFGPPGMLDLLIRESVNNKSANPELLETYAVGVLKPWFDNVTPEQVEAFVMKVHEVRDQFFKEGGVPEDLKTQLKDELDAHLHGAGLEHTLQEIGLDPLKAHIGANGFSGKIADSLGSKKSVEQIKSKYTQSYLERLHDQRQNAAQPPHSHPTRTE